jgi:hypothetical protein
MSAPAITFWKTTIPKSVLLDDCRSSFDDKAYGDDDSLTLNIQYCSGQINTDTYYMSSQAEPT